MLAGKKADPVKESSQGSSQGKGDTRDKLGAMFGVSGGFPPSLRSTASKAPRIDPDAFSGLDAPQDLQGHRRTTSGGTRNGLRGLDSLNVDADNESAMSTTTYGTTHAPRRVSLCLCWQRGHSNRRGVLSIWRFPCPMKSA